MSRDGGAQASIHEILAQAESEVTKTDQKIDKAEDSVAARNRLRKGADRSIIAWVIIGTYAIAVFAMVMYIFRLPPTCDVATISGAELLKACAEAGDERASLLLNAITTAVLPIVTLMLGFYFGVEKAEKAAAAAAD